MIFFQSCKCQRPWRIYSPKNVLAYKLISGRYDSDDQNNHFPVLYNININKKALILFSDVNYVIFLFVIFTYAMFFAEFS